MYTKKHKKIINKKVLAKNRKGAEVVLAEKPSIELNSKKEVVRVFLKGVLIPRTDWRKFCPVSRYDKDFKKIS